MIFCGRDEAARVVLRLFGEAFGLGVVGQAAGVVEHLPDRHRAPGRRHPRQPLRDRVVERRACRRATRLSATAPLKALATLAIRMWSVARGAPLALDVGAAGAQHGQLPSR